MRTIKTYIKGAPFYNAFLMEGPGQLYETALGVAPCPKYSRRNVAGCYPQLHYIQPDIYGLLASLRLSCALEVNDA